MSCEICAIARGWLLHAFACTPSRLCDANIVSAWLQACVHYFFVIRAGMSGAPSSLSDQLLFFGYEGGAARLAVVVDTLSGDDPFAVEELVMSFFSACLPRACPSKSGTLGLRMFRPRPSWSWATIA